MIYKKFIDTVSLRNKKYINGDFGIIHREEDIRLHDYIECECNNGHGRFKSRADHLIKDNAGCPQCTKTHVTHEKFLAKLKTCNKRYADGEFIINSTYVNSKTKVKCVCASCGFDWWQLPSGIYRNAGCPKCNGNYRNITTDVFIEELKATNDSFNQKKFSMLGQYINNKTKIPCICNVCGYKWDATVSLLRHGCGCPRCGGRWQKTYEEFIKDCYEKNHYIRDGDISIVGQYVNCKTPVGLKCNVCAHEWETSAQTIYTDHGCPRCAHVTKYTHSEYIHKLYNQNEHYRNGDFTITTTYQGADHKIGCKCNICGNEWEGNTSSLQSGTWCPVCTIKQRVENSKLTHESFTQKLCERNYMFKSGMFRMLSEYNGMEHPIKCECLNCGNIWDTTAHSLSNGSGCPLCVSSKGEIRVANYLSKVGAKFIHQYGFDGLIGTGGHKLLYDFWLPDHNVLIEYNGEQHFQPVDFAHSGDIESAIARYENQKIHDNLKRGYAKNNGIRLLEIAYTDFDNVEEILEREIKCVDVA